METGHADSANTKGLQQRCMTQSRVTQALPAAAPPAAAPPPAAPSTAAAATCSAPVSTAAAAATGPADAETLFRAPVRRPLPSGEEPLGQLELRRQAGRVTIHWESNDGVACPVDLQWANVKEFRTTKRDSGKARIRLTMTGAHDLTWEQVFIFADSNLEVRCAHARCSAPRITSCSHCRCSGELREDDPLR